jgi:hypothetical protein
MELVGPSSRTLVGLLFQMAYAIGVLMMPAVAFFVRDDFYIQLITMGPSVLFIPYVM